MDDTMMDDTMMDDTMMDDTMMDDTMMDDTMMDDTMMDDTMMPKSYQGTFVGVNDGIHNAEGQSRVIFLDDGRDILRLENFKSTNGPDLFVYLSTDTQATDIVNLGALKANMGNQNYGIPEGTDLEKYNNVLIWCKSFSTLFGSADLTSHS
ncbi:DM13 domain-containing protein [Nitrosopumilus ureiphilus]|uniref:DM13 domain-containing protein n=1 Tax=Nitrosopumilus ureiphilus TaxID=1470067 RepID=UPI001FE2C152|nr:DM13 domain-containing protein [Nitrosopumilus ureiphilus]